MAPKTQGSPRARGKRRTLLHACCGPCASACVPVLKGLGHEVTMLFANSNIDTREEFDRRLGEAKKLAKAEGVGIAVLPYDHGEWLREVAAGYEHEPEQGARCARCFRYNLAKTAAYAAEHGHDGFTTSLTVSPHKPSRIVFGAAESVTALRNHTPSPSSDQTDSRSNDRPNPSFLPIDFKKGGGYGRSVMRAAELGLYRQDYCGCEFSKERWNIHSKRVTESTNLDARGGVHRDVFTADYQTAGRGRLDHKWLSPEGANLMMSVVLSVGALPIETAVTLPLVAGLAVVKAVGALNPGKESRQFVSRPLPPGSAFSLALKWPNDVWVNGRKLAGILCERHGDNVIVGIGVNVRQCAWPDGLKGRATSLLAETGREFTVAQVRNAVLGQLGKWYGIWRDKGFEAVYPEIAVIDLLKGCRLSVRQADDDAAPVTGVSRGIMPDGTLDVGGTKVYAGEAHVEAL